uniref:U7-Theriditoxin-Lha1a_1 n=1 Tax=Latrodectus hasselti TaxID=256736 RepID=A0A482ZCY2_LATHA
MYLKVILAFIFIKLIGNKLCLGIPECGVRSANFSSKETRVVGGKGVAIGQYPWVVAIFRTEDCSNFEQICGGTIISERWVVTAGHCVCPRNPEAYRILAGTNHIGKLDVPSRKLYRVSQIFIHPDYSDAYYKNDIALVRTLTSIDISSGEIYINRICLPSVK